MATDRDTLKDITDAFANDSQEWHDIYAEGDTDVQVLSGGVWDALDPKGAKQRRDANRPMLAPDEIGQYINQVVNDIRANPRGIRFSPTGSGANDKGADFYQNKTREIEYRSNGTLAYTTAFQNCAERGFGYVRVNSRYVHDALFDPTRPADVSLFEQELWIDAVPNPNLVLPDPYALRPDLRDQKRCFVLEWRSVTDFRAKWPDAQITNFTPSIIAQAADWFTKDGKQVLTAEYWSFDHLKDRTLLLLKPNPRSNGQPVPVWQDEINGKAPSSDQILQKRKVPVLQVRQRITNGVEILETNDWAGKYIPITGCFGKMLYVDDGGGPKRKVLSMTRLARDPFLAYCYLWTCEAEIVGLTPKFPYFFYEGQLTPANLELLAKSLHEPVAGIPVKASIPGVTQPGSVLPFPQRNPYAGEALQYLELAKEAARRAIQAAMGITPLPTPAQRENQKSGTALRQIESSGQKGAFHLVDGYEMMIGTVGVYLEDLMDKTYDTARKTGVFERDDKAAVVSINDPADPESVFTAGSYQVTVASGPTNESQRQAADDLLDTMAGNIGEIAQIAGPAVAKKVLAETIKSKVQGPSGDQLADLISPPEDQQGGPSPQQVQQMQQENQQLKATLGEAQKVLQSEQLKYQAQFKIETMKAQSTAILQLALKKMDVAAKIDAAHITAAKEAQTALEEARNEAIALGLTHAFDADQADADRAHELGMAALGHTQTLQQGDQAHQQALEQGDQATAGAMAQQANQAALQPPSEAGA